jgi:hypothetical protein
MTHRSSRALFQRTENLMKRMKQLEANHDQTEQQLEPGGKEVILCCKSHYAETQCWNSCRNSVLEQMLKHSVVIELEHRC